jgi:glycosyltransferase involved in cell wall biosynthesis
VKLLEAFAMGMPVVTTSRGAAGFPIRHGVEALVAETPEEFRAAIRALRESPRLREDMGMQARRMVEDHFGWDALAPLFLELVESGCPPPGGPTRVVPRVVSRVVD